MILPMRRFTTKIDNRISGKNIFIVEANNLSSPQGILLKSGIRGGSFSYESTISTIEGIKNRSDKAKEILIKLSDNVRLNLSLINIYPTNPIP